MNILKVGFLVCGLALVSQVAQCGHCYMQNHTDIPVKFVIRITDNTPRKEPFIMEVAANTKTWVGQETGNVKILKVTTYKVDSEIVLATESYPVPKDIVSVIFKKNNSGQYILEPGSPLGPPPEPTEIDRNRQAEIRIARGLQVKPHDIRVVVKKSLGSNLGNIEVYNKLIDERRLGYENRVRLNRYTNEFKYEMQTLGRKEWIKEQPGLEVTLVPDQNMKSIPELFFKVLEDVNITKLTINGSKLTSLPESIGNLINLTTLDLKNNNLETLPESFRNLKNIRTLSLSGNPIPKNIFLSGNANAIEAFVRLIRETGSPDTANQRVFDFLKIHGVEVVFRAAEKGRVNVVETLVRLVREVGPPETANQRVLDFLMARTKDSWKLTVSYWAVALGNSNFIETLVRLVREAGSPDTANQRAFDFLKREELGRAAENGHVNVIETFARLVREAGSQDTANQRVLKFLKSKGVSALRSAAVNGHVNIVETLARLVREAGPQDTANQRALDFLNSKDSLGRTALNIALNFLTSESRFIRTASESAEDRGVINVIETLARLVREAGPTETANQRVLDFLNVRDYKGRTGLQLAVRAGNLNLTRVLVRLRLRAGANRLALYSKISAWATKYGAVRIKNILKELLNPSFSW